MTQAPERTGSVADKSGEEVNRGNLPVHPKSPADGELLWEVRLCFVVAAVSGLVGSLGWLLEQFVPGSNSLQALIVVAAFYALMGAVRSVKLFFGGSSSERPDGGH